MILTHGEKQMLDVILKLSCEAQFEFAQAIAANVGYELTPDIGEVRGISLTERVEKLEAAVRDLNPGLNI